MVHSNFKWNAIFYGVAIFVDRLIGFFLLPILTKILKPEYYGAWSQTGVVAGLLVVIVLYAFPTVIVKRYAEKSKENIRLIALKKIGGFCLCVGFLVCFLVFGNAEYFSLMFYGDIKYISLISSLILLMFSESIIEFSISWLRVLSRVDIVSIIVIFRSISRFLLAFLLAFYSRMDFYEWMLIYSSGIFIVGIFVILICIRVMSAVPQRKKENNYYLNIKNDIFEATPLVFLSILTILASTLDRFFLASFLDLDIVARYTVVASLASIPLMVHNILGFAVFPEMARFWSDINNKSKSIDLMSKSIIIYLFFALPIVLGMTFFGSEVILFLTTSDYKVPSAIFLIFSISVLSIGMQQIMIYALLLSGKSVLILLFAIFSFSINFLLLYVFVPWLGIVGAALAAAISNLVLALTTIIYLYNCIFWKFPLKAAAKLFFKILIYLLPSLFFKYYFSWVVGFFIFTISYSVYLYFDIKSKNSILRNISN